MSRSSMIVIAAPRQTVAFAVFLFRAQAAMGKHHIVIAETTPVIGVGVFDEFRQNPVSDPVMRAVFFATHGIIIHNN